MNCEEIREHFTAYIDGVAGAGLAAGIGEHLEGCGACRTELERLREVVRGLRSMEELDAPPDFLVRVREKIGKESAFRRLYRFLFVPFKVKVPVEALSLALVLIIFAYAFQLMPPKMERPLQRMEAETAELAKEPAEGRLDGYRPGVPVMEYADKDAGKAAALPEAEAKGGAPPPVALTERVPAQTGLEKAVKAKVARIRSSERAPVPPAPLKLDLPGAKVGPPYEITLAYRDRDETLMRLEELAAGLGGEIVVGAGDEERAAGEDVIEVAVARGKYTAFLRRIKELEVMPAAGYISAGDADEVQILKRAVIPSPDKEEGETDYLSKGMLSADSAVEKEFVRVKIRLVPE